MYRGYESLENKKFCIAIVDDEAGFAKQAERIVMDFFDSRQIAYMTKIYQSPEELLCDFDGGQYFDIYILDIQMQENEDAGMELARHIRRKYEEPYLMFLTSHMEYAAECYEYSAFRYIGKDVMQEKLPMALESIWNKIAMDKPRLYVIESHSKIVKVAYQDIFYLHIEGKYTCFYTRQGEFRERKSIRRVLDDLDRHVFIMTDKSYAVNISHIVALGDKEIEVRCNEGNILIPVSRPRYMEIKKSLSRFWRGKR